MYFVFYLIRVKNVTLLFLQMICHAIKKEIKNTFGRKTEKLGEIKTEKLTKSQLF